MLLLSSEQNNVIIFVYNSAFYNGYCRKTSLQHKNIVLTITVSSSLAQPDEQAEGDYGKKKLPDLTKGKKKRNQTQQRTDPHLVDIKWYDHKSVPEISVCYNAVRELFYIKIVISTLLLCSC